MKQKAPHLAVRVDPHDDNGAQVSVAGTMDAHTFEKFQKSMTGVTEAGTKWIVIDLRRMTYIASVGINFLINLRVQRRKVGGEVILVGPQPPVLKILKMLGLLEVLVVVATPEEAWGQIKAKINPTGASGVPLIE
jgi:anti-anti-sigma factor